MSLDATVGEDLRDGQLRRQFFHYPHDIGMLQKHEASGIKVIREGPKGLGS